MILVLFFLVSPLIEAAPKKKSEEPLVKPIVETPGGFWVLGFETVQEYSNLILMVSGMVMFGGREIIQYKRDKERLGALEAQRKEDSDKISSMEKAQREMFHTLNAFIKSVEKDEERMDRRVARLEIGDKQ